MVRTRLILVSAAIAALAGCAREGARLVPAPDGEPSTTEPSPTKPPRTFPQLQPGALERPTVSFPAPTPLDSAELRLTATNLGDVTDLSLGISGVTMLADGQPLQVTPGAAAVVLATGSSSSLGSTTLPVGATELEFTIQLDAWGDYTSAAGSGPIDVRVPAIRFWAPADWVREGGVVEVALDVGASLEQRSDGERLLLPELQIRY